MQGRRAPPPKAYLVSYAGLQDARGEGLALSLATFSLSVPNVFDPSRVSPRAQKHVGSVLSPDELRQFVLRRSEVSAVE